jgi:hypothetical protein
MTLPSVELDIYIVTEKISDMDFQGNKSEARDRSFICTCMILTYKIRYYTNIT